MDFNNLVSKLRDIDPSDVSVSTAQNELAGVDTKKETITESVAPAVPMDELAQFAALAGVTVKKEVVTESAEVVAEKSVSKAQQKAAGAALAAKRGDIPKSDLEGASKEMLDMSEKDLEDFAGTKHKGLPEKKTESFDAESFRKSFETMVEAKSKPDFLDLDKDGDKKEPMKKAAKDAKGGKKSGKKEMSDKQKKYFGKKDESVEEGKSPHKKGTEKYKKHMAAKHASMGESINESFEKFIGNEKMSFEDMVAIVKESGGQQQIDPVDQILWSWANRVAASKGEGEMFAAKIYESNGGRFELYDILSESTGKKPQGISESVQNFTDAGIPREYAEAFMKKYDVANEAPVTELDGLPKTGEINRGSFIINVLPNGDVRGFGKTLERHTFDTNFYSLLHMIDGKIVDPDGTRNFNKAKQGMSAKGKFYAIKSNYYLYRGEKPDSARDTRGDVMTGDGNIYGYMNNTFMKNMRPMMEKMVDDIYANLRKLDNKNKSFVSPSDQERALEAAKIIEEIAERGFNRSTMENFLTHLKRTSYGFGSIPANERELRKILKDTPNARAKWAKTVLDAAKRQHERVKDMLYKPTIDALKGEPENA